LWVFVRKVKYMSILDLEKTCSRSLAAKNIPGLRCKENEHCNNNVLIRSFYCGIILLLVFMLATLDLVELYSKLNSGD